MVDQNQTVPAVVPKEVELRDMPEFFKEFIEKYNASISHVFCFYGNIKDYINGSGINLVQTLEKNFNKRFEIIVKFNRSQGIHFFQPSMEEKFKKIIYPEIPTRRCSNCNNQFMPVDNAGRCKVCNNHTGGPEKDANEDNRRKSLPRDVGSALAMLNFAIHVANPELSNIENKTEDEVKKIKSNIAVILEYAELLFPEGEGIQLNPEDRLAITTILNWAQDIQIEQLGHPIILLANSMSGLNHWLKASDSRIEFINIKLPTKDERKHYIDFLLNESGVAWCEEIRNQSIPIEEFANLTAGLNRLHIEDITCRVQKNEQPISRDAILERKEQIQLNEFGNVIQTYDAEEGFESVIGLEKIKTYLKTFVIPALRCGDKKKCPSGLFFFGLPGVGKTKLAKAIAKESGVNFVIFNLAKIFEGLVGATERNMEKALWAIKSLSPTILFIDEIDQAVRRGEKGDGGVSNRVFKRLLEFLGDEKLRGEVLPIACTNRPELVDIALTRSGRFEEKIGFFSPEDSDRKELITFFVKKYDGVISEDELMFGVKHTDYWVQADIEMLVKKACLLGKGKAEIKEASKYVLQTVTNVKDSERYFLAEINDKSLLPDRLLHMNSKEFESNREEAIHKRFSFLEFDKPDLTKNSK